MHAWTPPHYQKIVDQSKAKNGDEALGKRIAEYIVNILNFTSQERKADDSVHVENN